MDFEKTYCKIEICVLSNLMFSNAFSRQNHVPDQTLKYSKLIPINIGANYPLFDLIYQHTDLLSRFYTDRWNFTKQITSL